jgi:general control protein GCN4
MNLQDLDFDDFTSFEGGASTTAYSSPALPTVFDLGSAPGSNNMGTVSPHDLLITEPFMSAPNSTALTTLTSPSVFDGSPSFDADNFECSPNFGTSDYEVNNPEHWFPLFPQTTAAASAPQVKPEQSPAEKSEELEGSEPAAPGHRRRSSGTSPPSGRHSSVSGVNSRRRDKPLPPIIVEDPHDTVAMKRARNTLAARKSRERKAQRLDELEERIEKLTQDRDYWKNKALALGAQE